MRNLLFWLEAYRLQGSKRSQTSSIGNNFAGFPRRTPAAQLLNSKFSIFIVRRHNILVGNLFINLAVPHSCHEKIVRILADLVIRMSLRKVPQILLRAAQLHTRFLHFLVDIGQRISLLFLWTRRISVRAALALASTKQNNSRQSHTPLFHKVSRIPSTVPATKSCSANPRLDARLPFFSAQWLVATACGFGKPMKYAV